MTETADLKAIVYDHLSGAREIVRRLIELLERQAAQSQATTAGELLDVLFDTAAKVVRSKPEMAAVFNTVDTLFQSAEAKEDTAEDVGEMRMEFLGALAEELTAKEARLDAAARRAAGRITNGAVVATHSRSSTVARALKLAKEEGKLFDVVLTESRPLMEGRTLAEELAREQIPVRLVIDAAIHTVADGADLVLVGSDAITREGVVNKIGTRALAAAAREAATDFVVITETPKAWRRRTEPALGLGRAQTREPREVWERPPVGVEVVNLTFDRTPGELVAAIAGEAADESFDAFWRRIEARGHSRRIREAFGDDLA